ncbi:MAG: Outer rane receptor protein [Myxococcaceae bacterium]|nr:Outer rane receptor protein [Myxococcaceae bacterium]
MQNDCKCTRVAAALGFFLWSSFARADVDAGSAPEDASVQAGAPDTGLEAPVQLLPPRVLSSRPPEYPASHLGHGEHPTVVLKVTILADASIADIGIEHTAGPDFDEAAIAAIKQWRFEPARRGELPIASRIGIAVHFELPELATLDVAAVTSAEDIVPHRHEEGEPHAGEPRTAGSPGAPLNEQDAVGATALVRAEPRSEERGINDYRLDRALLEAAPHADAADLLKGAPGLVVTRIEGDAVGHRLMLRGFDADHGQDIELTVDGVPMNQPSHIHGQGYADLGSIIPETVRSLRVVEGVYDPSQGDFAVAGSADFELGVEKRGTLLSSSYGAFDTFRELALWAPEGASVDTFAAVNIRKTQGFGQNRAGLSGSVVGQSAFGSNKLKLILHGSAYAARARTGNVLRRDDIESGKVGFYDVYPLATAQAQNAASTRAELGAKLRYHNDDGANGELSVYALFNDFRLLANYTGFTEQSRANPAWSGRGDLIEQLNSARTFGLKARHRSARYAPSQWAHGTLELGLSARVDGIEQKQNLIEAPLNTTWDSRVDANITATDIGGYLDLDTTLTRYVHIKGGVRADVLLYRVDDALQNFIASNRTPTFLPGYRRTAAGIATGPRVVLEVTPWDKLVLSATYGEGYRSPQALLLDEGEPAPFTKVKSADVGARYAFGELASIRASGYYTHLGQDVVFEPTEGRVAPAGPSTRLGAVLFGEVRPRPWLRGAASFTYVRATLDDPPPRTVEDPSPPFRRGQRLPYVPPCVLRVDASAEHALADVRGETLSGRLGLGFTYWSQRPLPYSEHTAQVSLLDGSAALTYRIFQLDLSVFNLLDLKYSAMELSAASNWDPTAIPSRIPERHVMAGAPRSWLLTLGVRL